jgi:hypothetical protein
VRTNPLYRQCRNTAVCGSQYAAFNAKVNQAPTSEELDECTQYSDSTCCDANYVKSFKQEGLDCAFSDLSKDCYYILLLSKCQICNPDVGTGKILSIPCDSYCEEVWDKCSEDKFQEYTYVDDRDVTRHIYIPSSDGKEASSIFADKNMFFLNASLPYNPCANNAAYALQNIPVTDGCWSAAAFQVPSIVLLLAILAVLFRS